jgi:amino acid adenylation domain-containing protein/non-ribosomal peptide synthase protein (TIGR01720 family)
MKGYRISPQQKQLWQQEAAACPAACAILLEGTLHRANLKRALETIVARHEILRTTFYRPTGMKAPFQVIAESGELAWHESDLRELPPAQQTARIETRFREEARQAFDLESGPRLRAVLLPLAERRTMLLLSLPAACADARTLGNLVRELSQEYGEHPPDGEALQYVDYSEWQHELAEGEEAKAGVEFWRRQNFDSLVSPKLPFESRPGEATGSGRLEPDSIELPLGAERGRQVEAAARACETTVEDFLLACWQTLLWRLTGDAEVVTAYVADGRKDDDLQRAMGSFARPLPLRLRFEEDSSFGDILAQVSDAVREARQYEEHFAWPEAPTHAPIGFAFTEWPATATAAGVSFSVSAARGLAGAFKLLLTCDAGDGALGAALHYDPACYARDEVERFAGYFQVLVESAARNAAVRCSELELLGSRERRQLLVDFNQTAAEYPRELCLHQLFEQQAEAWPDRPAVACAGRQLTYAELNARANQLAHWLRGRGVDAGVRVGLCVDRSVEMMVGLLAILKAGGAYVPLNPEFPKARLAQQLQDVAAPVVLTELALLDHLPEFAGHVLCLDRDAAQWAAEPHTNPNAAVTPEHPVYVIYTSGSTGVPKGVVIRHRNLVNYTQYICERLRAAEDGREGWNFATVSTITADLGNTCVFPSLASGGCLHILTYDIATNAARFAEYVARHPIDVLKIVPSHLNALLSGQPAADAGILPRKYLIMGGEALRFELIERIAAAGKGCRVINHYGPTETTIGSLTADCQESHRRKPVDGSSPTYGAPRPLSATQPIGRPIANTRIFVLDAHQKPAPIGVPGELYIGGAGLAEGYLNQPERTAERFVELRMEDDEAAIRVYRTGDLVRFLPDGQVEFLGRTDHQVKIRGYRIELEEIEVAIGQHPAVRQAVVVAREEEGGHKRLVAYVVGSAGAAELQSFLKENLPDYMTPSAIVKLEALPLTANGKVDRKALPAPEAAGADREYVAPRTPAEETLAGIWSQVLGVERVGIHDNFFSALGGDSILSIQIIARANQAGLRLTPKQIFEHQTVAELAAVAGVAAAVEAEQGLVTGAAPLTPIQHWFFEQDVVEPHHWNQSLLFETRQALDPALLEQVVAHLVEHHDALRLRFVREADGWRQHNAGLEGPTPFSRHDLSALPEAEQRPALEAKAAELQASLNLAEGPLLRIAHFDLGADKPGRLLLAVHHLAVDGVSWRILLEDLQTAYQQLSAGAPVSLPAKTTSFRQWAEKLHAYAQTDAVEREAAHWLALGDGPVRRLPVDFPGGANTVDSARTVTVALSPEQTEALLHQVPAVYHTQINDVLMTALVEALARWTGTRAWLIDLEGHGREEILEGVALWRTVGWFTTHFPVRLDLGAAADPGSALKLVKEQLRAVPNRGIGYGLLRYLSGTSHQLVPPGLRALPRPELSFNYLGQFDQVLPESSPFGPAPESAGPLQSPRGARPQHLSLNGSVAGGQLRLTLLYSETLYRRDTIERFAQYILDALEAIITHCQSPTAGGYTPSDFTLAKLDEQDLNQISTLLDSMDGFDDDDDGDE